MTDYTWPSDLAPYAVDFYLQAHSGGSESPFTRQTKTYGLSAPRWVCTLAFRGGYDGTDQLTTVGPRLDALVAKLNGRQNRVLLYDFRRPAMRGNWPVTAGNLAASKGDTSITITGLAPGTPVYTGDYIGGDGRPHIIGDDPFSVIAATADGWGQAVVSIEPPLAANIPVNGAVFGAVPGAFRLTSDDAGSSGVQVGDAVNQSLTFVEDLDTPAAVYPLDLLAASAAYGTRRLSSTYSGSALRVVRTSDSAALDIGFSGAQLDFATLNAFIAGTTGRVSKWYDQSGNGRDAPQATSANRAWIDNQLMCGNQMLQFLGGNSLTVPSSVVLDGQGGTVLAVGGILGWGFPTRGAWAQLGSSQFLFTSGAHFNIGGSWPGLPEAGWVNVVGFRLAPTGQTNIQNDDSMSTIAVQSAGALAGATIGDLPAVAGNDMIGQMSAMIFYSSALSDADLAAARLAYSSAFNIAPTTTKNIVALGDSIFAGQPLTRLHSAVRDAMAEMPSGVRFHNLSVGGATTENVTTLYPISYTSIIAAHKSVVVINLGTNNIGTGDSASTTFSGLTDLCNLVHADGGKVIICTLLPSNAYSAPKLAQLAALNTQIRSDWATIADGMIDYAADPVMGAPTAPADTTLYIDGIHPTELGVSYTVPATVRALLALV